MWFRLSVLGKAPESAFTCRPTTCCEVCFLDVAPIGRALLIVGADDARLRSGIDFAMRAERLLLSHQR